MRDGVFAFSVLAILAASSCGNSGPNQKESAAVPPNSEKVVTISSNELMRRLAGTVGRYQIFLTGQKALKLDTATGQTWVLEGSQRKPLSAEPSKADTATGETWVLEGSRWKPLSAEPSKADLETQQKIRTVVEEAVQPLIAVRSYNPATQRLEAVTDAERRRRIESIVQEALKRFHDLNIADKPMTIILPSGKKVVIE